MTGFVLLLLVASLVRPVTYHAVRFAGRPRAVLGALGDGSGLTLDDPHGTGRAALSPGADHTARLRFDDGTGRAGVSLDVTVAGASRAGFDDARGRGRAQRQVAAAGSPDLGFFDRDG